MNASVPSTAVRLAGARKGYCANALVAVERQRRVRERHRAAGPVQRALEPQRFEISGQRRAHADPAGDLAQARRTEINGAGQPQPLFLADRPVEPRLEKLAAHGRLGRPQIFGAFGGRLGHGRIQLQPLAAESHLPRNGRGCPPVGVIWTSTSLRVSYSCALDCSLISPSRIVRTCMSSVASRAAIGSRASATLRRCRRHPSRYRSR